MKKRILNNHKLIDNFCLSFRPTATTNKVRQEAGAEESRDPIGYAQGRLLDLAWNDEMMMTIP